MSVRGAAIGLPLFVIGAVMVMVVPVPPVVLDLLLAANIAVGILVLMSVVFINDPVDFAVFPSLLLILTLARLALNVSSTRLILLDGYAGKVIETFGEFVVGGSVIVGLVIFLILIVIQFAVITNGAGRVAEVTARFTLDAMPGKQMAIDADLAAGMIDETTARRMRDRIAQEAEFYGAMDGASKFVKGDVIAGVVIVLVNLVGGFAIGLGSGLSFSQAVSLYTILTVGDGLVSQIPALLTSIASGLLITRVTSETGLGDDVASQLLSVKRALRISAGVVFAMSLLPGLPKLPFWAITAALLVAASKAPDGSDGTEQVETPAVRTDPDDPEALIGDMRVEPLEVHLAYDILDLVDNERGGDLLERVRALRRQVAMELGFVMPLVRTRDDLSLAPETYTMMLDGAEVARGTAPRDRVLALPAGDGSELISLGGTPTTEPVFGLAAFWIPTDQRAVAAASGATVVDRSSVLVTHLAEVVRRNAARLLTRQDVQMLVEGMRYDHPILARDVDNDVLPLPTLHAVLRGLLDDGVSIRHLGRIVESVSAMAGEPRSVDQLVAGARIALAPAIAAGIAPDGRLAVATLDPSFEAQLHEGVREIDGEGRLVLDPRRTEHLVEELRRAAAAEATLDQPLALVCGQHLRKPMRRLLDGLGLGLDVLAYPELPDQLQLTTVAVLGPPALTEEAGRG